MISSVYIHIPFCNNICSYCDFPKVYKNDCFTNKYLDSLKKEIKSKYKGEIIDTIYIGGGTPSSLSIEELNKLFDILSIFNKKEDIEFTIECNLDSLTIDKLKLFKNRGINRLSIGVETFNDKYLAFLNRTTSNIDIIYKAKELGFNNINIDLIYAIPGETLEELENDINKFLTLDIEHISLYSLILEKKTVLYNKKIKPIDEDLDNNMYNLICKILKEKGYIHYEVSNFSKKGYYSRHNLKYWNNEYYYGFGMGASGYIDNIRYTNTKSIINYINGKTVIEEEIINKNLKMEYEMILGLRKLEGVSLSEFKNKFNLNILDIFDINKLLEEGILIIEEDHIKIPEKYIYISNSILINFIGVL